MSVLTYEAVVEEGKVRLLEPVVLPENVRVYVVVTDTRVQPTKQIRTPRLKNPSEAADFVLEVS
jgi:hypothetical protein